MGKRIVLLLCLAFSTCSKKQHTIESSNAKPAALVGKSTIKDHDARGVSGLDAFRNGTIAVAERSGFAFHIEKDGAFRKLTINGHKSDIDLEGVATLDDDTVLFSTERSKTHDYEEIWVGTVKSDRIDIASKHTIPKPSEWTFGHNNGLEGICISANYIWVIAEIDFKDHGKRSAGLARIHKSDLKSNDDTTPTWFSVPLTSAKGKLSALDCDNKDDHVVFWAVERHFGVSRIIEFKINTTQDNTLPIQSSPILELAHILPVIPNFEGLVRSREGHWVLINDNEYTTLDGDTFLTMLK